LRNAAEGDRASVPGSVQSLVQARLDRHPAMDKVALQAASVLGQRFDRGALAYLLDAPSFDYWIPGSLAEPALGRREAPIRVLGTRNDGS
jgi:hypothetical protein